MDLRQIAAGDLVQHRPSVEVDCVSLHRPMPRLLQRLRGRNLVGTELREHLLDLSVAFLNSDLVEVVQRQGLGQGEDVLGLIVADQGCPDSLIGGLAAYVTHGCQLSAVALACNDRASDPHPGDACNVADHMLKLQVHQDHRLLHVHDMGSGVVKMTFALP